MVLLHNNCTWNLFETAQVSLTDILFIVNLECQDIRTLKAYLGQLLVIKPLKGIFKGQINDTYMCIPFHQSLKSDYE